MNKPVAVIINDVHYNLQTIPLADASMRMAIQKSNELKVPLIVAGDLHDTKANMRAECITAMIETFKLCDSPPFILVGNHDKINEKSEEHSLEFLRPYAAIIDYMPIGPLHRIGYLIPYQHDVTYLRQYLKTLPEGKQLIMHQGLNDSNSGEYYQDKSALDHSDVTNFRVISGHYHYRQNIKTGRARKGAVGLWSYTGNPYSLNFGEANDPPKGFHVLMSDGSLEFIPTNLRKHVVLNGTIIAPKKYESTSDDVVKQGDLVWLKLSGIRELLATVDKKELSLIFNIFQDYKLDLIPADPELQAPKKKLNQSELLDAIIESGDYSDERKANLKQLWRSLGS